MVRSVFSKLKCIPTGDNHAAYRVTSLVLQIRIAALNAASETADEHEDHFKSTKPSQTKEAQVSRLIFMISMIMMMRSAALILCDYSIFFICRSVGSRGVCVVPPSSRSAEA